MDVSRAELAIATNKSSRAVLNAGTFVPGYATKQINCEQTTQLYPRKYNGLFDVLNQIKGVLEYTRQNPEQTEAETGQKNPAEIFCSELLESLTTALEASKNIKDQIARRSSSEIEQKLRSWALEVENLSEYLIDGWNKFLIYMVKLHDLRNSIIKLFRVGDGSEDCPTGFLREFTASLTTDQVFKHFVPKGFAIKTPEIKRKK